MHNITLSLVLIKEKKCTTKDQKQVSFSTVHPPLTFSQQKMFHTSICFLLLTVGKLRHNLIYLWNEYRSVVGALYQTPSADEILRKKASRSEGDSWVKLIADSEITNSENDWKSEKNNFKRSFWDASSSPIPMALWDWNLLLYAEYFIHRVKKQNKFL